jgi:hypothetical protein
MSLMLSSDGATDHGRKRLREPRAAEQIVALLRLTLWHDYGASALQGMRLMPAPSTEALCRQYGLLLRHDDHGLALFAPQRALPELWQAQREEACDYLLAWRLDCSQALFALASADEAPRHLLQRLAPCSAMDTDCESWCASLDSRQELRLPARHCEWKYLLLGDWASLAASGQVDDLRITAAAGAGEISAALDFQRDAAPEALPDGRLAWVYRSPELLPLAEQSSRRITLSDSSSSCERILISSLAHGAPSKLRRETRAGHTRWVTEIFLTR